MQYFFLGDEELVTAFRFIGIDGIAVKDQQHAIDVFTNITENPAKFSAALYSEASRAKCSEAPRAGTEEENVCQVLLLTEETADWLGEYMINWQLSGHYPLIVEIPGISGRLPDRKTLVEAIREAIGIHV